jgi:APA family basic amino acid/polyamine antiporter
MKTDLKQTLGLPSLLFFGVGVIIGGGIYSVIGAVAGAAGPLVWLSFALAAVPAALTALHYAELVAMFPRVGAEYTFLREAFPRRPWLPFGAGFLVTLTNAATAATVALAFAGYLEAIAGVAIWAGALGLLAACTLVNVAGIRESAWLTAAFTLIELAGLALVVGASLDADDFARGAFVAPHAGVLAGAALGFFVYTGFEGIVNLAEEAREPKRDLPRALLVSGAITTAAYLLVALAVVGLAPPEALAASGSPLSTALASYPALATAVAVIALFSTANTALITLLVGSRVLLGMARSGDMPRALAGVSKRQTPWLASLVVFAGAASLLTVGQIAIVSSVSSLATLIAFAAVAASVIALRRREPERERPFRVPGSVAGVPLLSVVTIAAVAALATQFAPAAFAIVAFALALGVALALTRRFWSR